MFRPLHIEVNLAALRSNYKAVRNLLGAKTKIAAIVKQSAYGHGLIPVAQELSRQGVSFLGVGSIEEGIVLRDNGFREPILVLTAPLPKITECFLEYKLTPTVVDVNFSVNLNSEAAKKNTILPVHVKIDTGMGRLGLYYKDAYKFIKELKRLKNIFLEGIYTHFPAADTDPEFTNYQIGIFDKFISQIKQENISLKYYHCANSTAIVNYPNSHFNMVRPGLILYGVKPAANIKLGVRPVLSLKSKIIFVKKIDKGRSVSYGRTYVAKTPAYIATVAAGYADGYPWALSNCGKVIIKDSFFNIAGRVCMDHIMVDLGRRQDIGVGQEVVLIGRSKNLEISAQDLADWAKTIPYEIISRLSLKIPRIYKSL